MMTKEEFDALLSTRCCCVRADTMEQWLEINQYCVEQLGLRRSEMYWTHDCEEFPYVYIRTEGIVGALTRPGSKRVIPFIDFLFITSAEEEEILCGSLEEVL